MLGFAARVAAAARTTGASVTPLGMVTFRNFRGPVELFALDFGFAGIAEVIDPVCRMRIALLVLLTAMPRALRR